MRNKTSLFAKQIRSDLAIELVKVKKGDKIGSLTRSEITLDVEQARKIGKQPGRYLTYETEAFWQADEKEYSLISQTMAQGLRSLVSGNEILVVGLGNEALAADSLGVKTCAKISVTRKIEGGAQISCLTPGVLGRTGIESFEVVKGVVSVIKPTTVIAVDSLCAGSTKRLLSSVQISDAGITPGSGVGNHRMTLSSDTLGCNVVCIGIPTVVYASTLVCEADGEPLADDMVVTPKDIESIVEDCARTLADAIESAIGG